MNLQLTRRKEGRRGEEEETGRREEGRVITHPHGNTNILAADPTNSHALHAVFYNRLVFQ